MSDGGNRVPVNAWEALRYRLIAEKALASPVLYYMVAIPRHTVLGMTHRHTDSSFSLNVIERTDNLDVGRRPQIKVCFKLIAVKGVAFAVTGNGNRAYPP